MYGMDTHITVKTLLKKGISHRQISSTLGIHRKVIKRIEQEPDEGLGCSSYHRARKLDGYEDQIKLLLNADWTAELIHKKLIKEHALNVSYATVSRFVRSLKSSAEAYVPMETGAGEEAQVDFGYLGKFKRSDGSQVKCWVFCMVLSYSRFSYFEVVTNQSLETFIHCHMRAFEAFSGVPRLIRIDNLKAGVTVPDFFEPLIQEQYASFLAHYGAVALPCRVYTPQHKGKVESGVKYVKNNFLRGVQHQDWERLGSELRAWTDTVANRRTHGTTKRIPSEVWRHTEREALLMLPELRYTFYHVEERKVNRFGHVIFRNNYYSVPYTLVGQTLRLFTDGALLRISHQGQEVALHCMLNDKGQYATQNAHLPPHKQVHSPEYYAERLRDQIGLPALQLMQLMQQNHPSHWKEKVRGLLHLRRAHPQQRLAHACQRALDHGLSSYRAVRDICTMLEHTPPADEHFQAPSEAAGMAHDLSIYDQISS
jgi:transposase/predicted secreted protein